MEIVLIFFANWLQPLQKRHTWGVREMSTTLFALKSIKYYRSGLHCHVAVQYFLTLLITSLFPCGY
jgi:hypothetical protein